jgi:hypothetical protein
MFDSSGMGTLAIPATAAGVSVILQTCEQDEYAVLKLIPWNE